MEDKFLTLFEKLNSINISLYIREKDIIEAENVISYLTGNNDENVQPAKAIKTLRQYKRLLKKLHRLQKKDLALYNNIHAQFLGLVNACDAQILQNYARVLTKKEHKFKEDYEVLQSKDGDPVEIQRLKIVAKSYYDSIEAIYQYIDLKLQMSDTKKLEKTTL